VPLSRTWLVVACLAAAVLPFALYGALMLVARIWKVNLRGTLPWLKALRWVSWLAGVPMAVAGLSDRYRWLSPVGISLAVSAQMGFAIVSSYIRRRYAPETVITESPDGWWPTPRT